MWRLAIFPSNGLDRSLHAPVLVGLFLVTFFTEAFGWTYAGLVVPGYLAALLVAAPVTFVLITVEAILTYLIVASLGVWIPKMGAWSTTFGRERFFLFIVAGVLVRVGMEGYFVPHVVARWSFAHSRELYSVGLVLVPLYANTFWTTGFRATAPRLGVVVALTYVVVEYVLVRHTNFSVSRLLVGNESGASEFLASPKAQMLLVIGALLGARGNVLYGWDYNGILIPGLLAVAWYQPTKLGATILEALLVYGLSVAVVQLPPLSRALIVGTRRMLVTYSVGFAVKIAIGFAAVRIAPGLLLPDYFGYGYLLPSLLAVKMWNKGKIGVVLMPALQVSLTAFVVGNVVGVSLSAISAAWGASKTSTPAIEPTESPAFDLILGDSAPDTHGGYTGWTSRDGVGALVRVAAEARATGDVSLEACHLADEAGMVLTRDPTRAWITVRPRANDPDADAPAPRASFRAGRGASMLVVARPRAAGASLTAVAFRAAVTLDAAAVVVLSRHGEMERSDRVATDALIRGLAIENVLVVESGEGDPRLSVLGTVPAGLDVEALGRALGRPITIEFRAASVGGDPWADIPRLVIGAQASDDVAASLFVAPPIEEWPNPLHVEIAARIRPLTAVGVEGYRPPTFEEMRLLATTVIPALAEAGPDRDPGPWTRALSARLRYRLARLESPSAWALFEPDSPTRRGQPTFITRVAPTPTPLLIEVPAPRWEVGAYLGGIALFEALDARALLIAGALPHEGTRGLADVRRAEARGSFYQILHERWLERGGRAVSVQGIAPDRTRDYQVVLSVGREIADRSLEPVWTQPLRAAFEDVGYEVKSFDGTGPQALFGGGDDPTMAFAQKFTPDSYAMIWLGAGPRSALATAEKAERLTATLARTHAIPTSDVATEIVKTVACGGAATAPCPAPGAPDGCDLESATAEWLRFSREGNVFDVEGAGTGYGCLVRLVRDSRTTLVWALVSTRAHGRAIPIGIPVGRVSRPLRDVDAVARAMWLRLAAVDVRGGPP